ncbi:MAG: GH25 family lysozyme [bacterium]
MPGIQVAPVAIAGDGQPPRRALAQRDGRPAATRKLVTGSRPIQAIGVAAIAVGTLVALLLNGFVRFNYPSESGYPVRGIDVSHHQGEIDWQKVGQAGIAFAFIKATEGVDVRDRQFDNNWAAANAAGLQRGGYHFFTFCSPGKRQALNFIAAMPPGQQVLPPAVDVEFDGNGADPPPSTTIRGELSEFLLRIEAAYGVTPIMNATRDAYTEILAGHFPAHAVWARNVFSEPRLTDGRDWILWQYADRGRVPGVATLVDLNVFRGSADAFESFAKDGRQRQTVRFLPGSGIARLDTLSVCADASPSGTVAQ